MKNLSRFVKTFIYILKSFKRKQYKVGLEIVYLFLKTKFVFQIKKIKLSKIKKNHKELIASKKINYDFFSHKIPYIYNVFERKNNLDREIKILEIGCFEGNSTLFFLELFNNSQIYCVDTFKPYSEIPSNDLESLNRFKNVFKNFKFNTEKYKDRVKVFDSDSDDFFSNKKMGNIKFDLVYVDGSHHAENVWRDLNNSFLSLNDSGYIICDDYTWNKFDKLEDNPICAINRFITENKSKLKIIKVYDQIVIQKK